jgi:DNA-binding response OmpR family regulator
MIVPKILAVDDNAQVRELVRDFLESRGYEVALAEDGSAALEAIAASPPDVLLLDLMMPGVSGLAVLRRVRAEHPQVPTLVLTAVQEEIVGREALDLGAVDYLTKPVDLRLLERAVQAALSLGQTSQ